MTVRTPVARAGLAFWSIGLVVALSCALASPSTVAKVVLLALAVVALRMALRSLSVGVSLTASEIVVSGWIRTYSIASADVASIDAVPYTGLIGGRDVDRSYRMPRIRRHQGRDVYVESLMGTPERVADVVKILNQWLHRMSTAEE